MTMAWIETSRNVWGMTLGDLRVVVQREEGDYYLVCPQVGIRDRLIVVHNDTSMPWVAQREALRIVRKRLEMWLAAFPPPEE